MILFWTQAKYFDAEPGGTWRGRAINGRRELNFKLPLPKSTSEAKAEAATVYELARIFPNVLGPGEEVKIVVSCTETKELVEANKMIQELLADVEHTIEVADGSQGSP